MGEITRSSRYKLSPYERAVLICDSCKSGVHLYKDAHGVFCHLCGPSVRVTTREIGDRSFLLPDEAGE